MAEVGDNLKANENIVENKSQKKNKTLSLSAKHVLRKKQPFVSRNSDIDVYVNNKTSLKGQLCKCEKLFDKGASELIIHGLGAAIYKAVNLALRLNEIHHGTLDLDIKTSTITLVDELQALCDDVDDEIRKRQNSAIHIRVVRKVPLAVLRTK